MHCKFTATVLAPSILSGILSGTLSGSLAGHFVEAVRCRPALAPPSLRDEHPQGASSCRGAGRKGEGRGGGGGGGAGAGFDHSRGISQGEDDTPIPTPMPLPCRCLVRLPGGWRCLATAERGLKLAPEPKRAQRGPRGLPDRHKTAQEAPKRTPRRPKRTPRLPKRASEAQEGPNTAPGGA